jgi:hypothetical protein
MAAAAPQIPDPWMAWEPSVMTEVKVQVLVDRGLLRHKAVVEWKAPAGKAFLMQDDKEQVVFTSFFERGFDIPAGDFFRGLLFY